MQSRNIIAKCVNAVNTGGRKFRRKTRRLRLGLAKSRESILIYFGRHSISRRVRMKDFWMERRQKSFLTHDPARSVAERKRTLSTPKQKVSLRAQHEEEPPMFVFALRS